MSGPVLIGQYRVGIGDFHYSITYEVLTTERVRLEQ